MKKFFIIFTLFAVLFSTSFDVDARKKFGSKSTGKTQQTSQQKQQADQPNNTAAAPAATAAKSSSKKGIMGGILGGLLVGGLIATMLGGDFEGLQIMDMLLMALLAFVIFKVVKMVMAKNRQSQPMPAGGPSINPVEQTPQYRENTTGGFATSQDHVPFNLPSGFDTTAFLQGARDHYHTLQKAWNNNDLTTIEEYVSPALFNELKAERADVADVATEVLFLDAELARADSSPILWEVSVRFKGKYRDLGDTQEEMINEVWHLERDMRQSNAPWLIVGIEDQAA
ncbi:Tim44 domain-containing protein [Pseudoalteromonas tunicata]|jgi:predicted lipid-binding transport protein (Tim44 family)|uniref:Tim44-like domain-containing protein n=2 Tax=Pseudoalteromonas tunicata TaxID=314281 RepID=A4C692_9GAMM|nr:Tim44-like domain-containing protein [Pseudoalteromonas tunicata]ATC95470.1 hypothetical protein PTUN_a3083 [Pseudoalteromonas tunicata]AXT31045.1 Tim44 domain-containing protein [Pseudoalteromonas tunicata]EAR29496.1 hypothetical protein PTD2_11789 [Pseudoalteromonas tunicata D2]MDP5212400.1 Tim44-like domain-containing protein [Pseudoalteromonas tunicata]